MSHESKHSGHEVEESHELARGESAENAEKKPRKSIFGKKKK